ncbi:MAG: geranylgeranylglyceryl/heptaprenylglyceryl phosphate synthase [Zestosphaera sp.]
MSGRRFWVDSYLRNKLNSGEKIHFTLLDPDKISDSSKVDKIAETTVSEGTDAFLIGGSIGVSERDVDEVVVSLKKWGLPVILFPGNVSGISKHADAILFMSLLNSDDPYFIIGAQVLGAPLVAKYELEVLPTGYVIVGYGGVAGYVGRARPVPYDKPELGVAYVLAARFLGMKYVYLEAGSGAPEPIPPKFLRKASAVKGDSVLIVGGGIRTYEHAKEAINSGADIVVTGTAIEENAEKAREIIRAVKKK